MKTLLLLIPLLPAAVLAQGTLNPALPPAPSMKTLGEMEGRTPILTLPLTIGAAGSYYFTKDLLFAGAGNAITITASNVAIDLGGFRLQSSAAVTGRAISIDPNLSGIRIKNGMIAGTTAVSVAGLFPSRNWTISPGGFANGIFGDTCNSCEFSDLIIEGCRMDGMDLGGCNLLDQIISHDNGGYGIDTNDSGNRIANCTAYENGATGIYSNYGVVTGCTAVDNGTQGFATLRGVILGCVGRENKLDGIIAGESVIANCIAQGNGRNGIDANGANLSLSTAGGNNQQAAGGVDVVGTGGAVRYGNFPTP